MNKEREMFILAEEWLIKMMESYIEFAELVYDEPDAARLHSIVIKQTWQPFLDEVKAKHAELTTTVKDGK